MGVREEEPLEEERIKMLGRRKEGAGKGSRAVV